MRSIGSVLLLAVYLVTGTSAQQISGTVTDTLTGTGILRATVQVKGTANQALTDAQGRFSLAVATGIADGKPPSAPQPFFSYHPAQRTIYWDGHQYTAFRLFTIDGTPLVRQAGGSWRAFPAPADGIYALELEASGGRSLCKMVVAAGGAMVSFSKNGETAAKAAAESVTLVFSRTGYVAREQAVTVGDNAVSMKLRTTYPATPAEIGPTNPGALRSSGSITVTTGNRVIENIQITGGEITIYSGSNITIRNFKIVNPGYWGINVDGGTNVVIEDGEIYGGHDDGIAGSNYTARRVYIHNMGADAFKAFGNCRIERCYATLLGQNVGAHSDGVQGPWGPCGNCGPVQIVNNNFALTNMDNACDFACEHLPAVLTEGNRLNGGSYTVYCGTNHTVINNVFGRDYSYNIRTDGCGTWSGNIWFDTARPAQ